MFIPPESYELHELARAAGVTPRTVRYYIQQGLVASPGQRGPGSRYDAIALVRIKIIRRWQRVHLPLAEIRRRLEGMSDEEARETLDRLESSPSGGGGSELDERDEPSDELGGDEAPGGAGGAKALSYLRRLLDRDEETRGRNREAPPALPPLPASSGLADFLFAQPSAPLPEVPPEGEESTPMANVGGTPSSAPTRHPERAEYEQSRRAGGSSGQDPRSMPSRSTWERHTLAPDVEVHVRRPLTRELNRKLERLLDLARRIFEEEG